MKLYNTLTRKKENLAPIKKNQIGFYSCGPTVYNYAHIGNLRTYVFSDILQRALEYNRYKVKRVMNITDVGHLTSDADTGEDKVEKEAKKERKTVWQVAKFYEKSFLNDLKDLNIIKPSKVIRATETVEDQIELIKELIKKKYAYETDNAVYFDVSKFKKYGKLSGQNLDDKLTAARDEVIQDKEKKNGADFALWFKLTGHHKDHAMHWLSPWGEGFPGWHIECSAIASKSLGQPFDIHTGGIDLIGTHHENEIAQSEAAYGKPLANIWMHVEFLNMGKGKMAKSSGTFITMKDVKEKGFDALAYRYLLLTAHYRTKIEFSWESLKASQNAYHNLISEISRKRPVKTGKNTTSYQKKFKQYIDDDLDIPKALALLWDAAKNKDLSQSNVDDLVKEFDEIFGLDLIKQSKKLSKEESSIPQNIAKLAKERWELRQNREFDKADKIRLTLANKGYEIEDQDTDFVIKKLIK
ncbi:MAG: cysteine--tRNA ligase [Patescibacteria group bacterium]|nr:cysteine--tRNA ligase [Patescibacteria group bacterium]